MCVERVEQGAQDTALWGSYIQGVGVGGELSRFMDLCAHSVFVYVVDPLVVLVSVA